jgi:hypothetical protein
LATGEKKKFNSKIRGVTGCSRTSTTSAQNRSLLQKTIRAKSPKGASGLAQQVRKIEGFLKRLSVQKSPKGAAGLIQQARQNASALHPCTSLHQETIRAQTNYRRSQTNIINAPDQARNAPIDIAGYAKAHSLIIQTIVTHLQRGHHTLHRFNLRDDSHLPIVK